jgi:hypothetical protein
MRRPLIAVVAFAAIAAWAQAPAPPPPCDSIPESKQFDFWVGDWDAAYTMGGKALASRNRISKILDGCAVLEEFTGAPGIKLEGRSHSVYDRGSRKWKQTWVDNSGSYLDFVGELADGRMILSREAERAGRKFLQRMVWQDIQPSAFKWLWQRSDDGGATWNTLWAIDYKRR